MQHTIRCGPGAFWRVIVPVAITVSVMLVACGGGGGDEGSTASTTTTTTPTTPSSTVTGTAASGAPLANILVTLKDSANKSVTATTSVSGAFTLDSSNLTPPFLLQVTTPGGTKLLSVSADANKTTTINVTPLTDVVVRSWYGLQGKSGDSAFSDPVTLPPPAPARVHDLLQALFNALQLAITANGAPVTDPVDLIAKPFAADHTGIDKLLDNAKVTVGNAGIQLVLTAGPATQTTQLTFDTAASAMTASTTTTSGTATTTSSSMDVIPVQSTQSAAIDAMKATLASATSTINSKGTALAAADLEPFFASDLLQEGEDRTLFLQELVPQLKQAQSVNLEVQEVRSLDLAAGKSLVVFHVSGTFNGAAQSESDVVFFERGSDGTWRYAGDGRIASVSLQAEGRSHQGLFLQQGNNNLNGPSVNLDVRPPLGLVSAVSASSSFPLPAFQRESTDASDPALQRDVFVANTGPMTGTLPTAGTPVNFTLTKAAGGTVTYTLPLNAFTTEQIQITTPTAATTSIRAGTATVAWTLPKTYAVQRVKVNVQTFTQDPAQPGGFQCSDDGVDRPPTTTTATVTVPSTCNGQPVTVVNISVATEGLNGERSMVIQEMNLSP